jgi:hypothetical protein
MLLLSQRQLVMPISIFVAGDAVCFKLAAQQKPADEIGKWTFFVAIFAPSKVRMLSHINHIETGRERVTMSSSPPTEPSMDDTPTAKSSSVGDDEKTIPFLR